MYVYIYIYIHAVLLFYFFLLVNLVVFAEIFFVHDVTMVFIPVFVVFATIYMYLFLSFSLLKLLI